MAKNSRESDSRIRHLAYQILAQLPEEEEAALRILQYARQLLLHPVEEQEQPPVVMKLVERQD